MPGSATLDEDVLLDSLIPDVVDGTRELQVAFGLRQFHVHSVIRRWPGGTVGLGTFVDEEAELTPRPIVEPFTDFQYRLEPCGLDESGYVRLSEVSLTYTEAELGGPGAAGEGEQHLFKISEAHGQATSTRYFVNRKPPYPDRLKTLGWILHLSKAQVAAAPDDAEGDAMPPIDPANVLSKDLGQLAVDGSTDPELFDYVVPAGKLAVVQRLTFVLRCAGALTDNGFGDSASALANGLTLQFLDTDEETVLLDLLDGSPLKRNDDWARLVGVDVALDTVLKQLRVTVQLPSPIEVLAAQRFRVTVADDLSGFAEFRAFLYGYLQND